MTTMSVTPSPAHIPMPDSVTVADLPPGYPAYLGYVDGNWPTAAELAQRFPLAQLVRLTVTGNTLQADGIDVEPGNVNAADARVWVQKKLAADPGFRPVIYASVQGAPNYGMADILARLNGNRISVSRVRLLSAHYGWGPHVCGPDSCRLISVPMDGTQWTSMFKGLNASDVDMSMLAADFFQTQPDSTETEKIMQKLPVVRQGMTGPAVRRVQGLVMAAGVVLTLDGVYGARTVAAVQVVQEAAHLALVDGVVGPKTWPVLLGVA